MHHIQGCDRNQTLLLPNSVDDYIGPDNPVRFVDAFVEPLDLQEAGFCRVEPEDTGRPGYHPADLLKLYIYGYLNRVRSSRRLEAETRRNLEVVWLLRGLTPDFKTIADFNRCAFKPVFRRFVLLCRKLELTGKFHPSFMNLSVNLINTLYNIAILSIGTDRVFTRSGPVTQQHKEALSS